jgi:hypothetical protein
VISSNTVRLRLATLSDGLREGIGKLLSRYTDDSPEIHLLGLVLNEALDANLVSESGLSVLVHEVRSVLPQVNEQIEKGEGKATGLIECLSVVLSDSTDSDTRSETVHATLTEHGLLITCADVLASVEEVIRSVQSNLRESSLSYTLASITREEIRSMSDSLDAVISESSRKFRERCPCSQSRAGSSWRAIHGLQRGVA